jgi:RimJ/RimL family protein N-acetyltransferase
VKASFLSGELVYIRAMKRSDKDQATAWFDSPFPVNATRAETFLREEHTATWHPQTTLLILVRPGTDDIIGGVSLWTEDRRVGWFRISLAPGLTDADAVHGDALRVLIPWWRDEHEFMAVNVELPADRPAAITAAEDLGMVHAVTWRQSELREGHPVDLLLYQALNPRGEVADA